MGLFRNILYPNIDFSISLCISLTFTMLPMSPAVALGYSLFLRNLNAIKHAARKDFFACRRACCGKLVVSYSLKLRQEITTNR